MFRDKFTLPLIAVTGAALLLTGTLIWYNAATAPPAYDVLVSLRGETAPPVLKAYPELEGVRIPINNATAADLEILPNIGPERAAQIVAYITAYGPITSLEELLEVKGIGEKTLETIRPYLTLDSAE